MSVASFIASQRAEHSVPHAISCRALGVSESWFYKWHDRAPTPRQLRRATLDKAVREAFEASGATYGSPRVREDWSRPAGRCRKRPWLPRCAPRDWSGGPSAATAA